MAVSVKCRCGRSYNLKDEFAGKVVRCPHCGGQVSVPGKVAVEARPQADPAFDRDVFLLRQKHLSLNEKYVVWDEQGRPILFIERPSHLARGCLAGLAAFGGAILVAGVLGALAAVVPVEAIQIALGISAFVGFVITLVALLVALQPKRHVTVTRDETRSERLLEILQDAKWQIPVATYTVRDPAGEVLARLRKNHLYNFFRKRWQCYAPDGSLWCVAMEDSMILSLLRRFLGPLFGVLRTNFIILAGESDKVIGEFNRKFTILDRYALDLKEDPARTLDRRVAVALGVMLDTGERR